MVYGYLRVSTDTQTVENQRYEINKFATFKELKVDKFIEETISGGKAVNKRKLGKLLKTMKKGDVLITTEISRLGRSLYMIMDILNLCMEKGVLILTIKDNFHLGDDIESKVLAFAFSLSAEIERRLISQRTKEALERIKREGRKLGRPKGRQNKVKKLDGKMDIVLNMFLQGFPITQIAKKCGVHPNTLYKLNLKSLSQDSGV